MARYLHLLFVVSLAAFANGAAIDRTTDSYQNLPVDDLDINENLIPHEEPGDIEGLLPPKPEATDFYQGRRESIYVIDKANNTLALKGESNKEEDRPSTEDTMRDWAELFEKFLKNENIRPSVTVSDDGMTLELAGVDEKSDEINIRDYVSITTEVAVETTTDAEMFTTDDANFPADEPRADDEESRLVSFFSAVWDVIRSSVQYAGDMLRTLTTSTEENLPKSETGTEPSSTEVPASSVATLLAFEEPAKISQLPSHEFEKGGRDIDSLLYGHGIV